MSSTNNKSTLTKDESKYDDSRPGNFVFPVRELESERVKLTLFSPTLLGPEFVERTKPHPELFKYLPYGPFDTMDEFMRFYEKRIADEETSVLFAILDRTGGNPRFAGVVGLLNSSVVNQCTEIGYITTFPEFHRTHVTSNAVGLLLHYCLEVPGPGVTTSSSTDWKGEFKFGPGLGLRRVQWQTHGENTASLRAAERMGFRREGLIRWARTLLEGKHGESVDPQSERSRLCSNPGRHSWMLSVCWDDWEIEGTRELVRRQMERV